jgi:hypothetical protein
MRTIKIEEALPGMKIAKGVTDNVGTLLLPEGIVLTPELLDRLRGRKVMFLCVEGEGPGSAGTLSGDELADALAKIDAEMDALFGDTKQHAVMAAICDAAKRVLKAKLESKPVAQA